MPKSNRCSSTPKYPRVETIQEQELEGENKQVYGIPTQAELYIGKKREISLEWPTTDRQERDRKGRKVQENTRKKI
ncbi:uncharacterized protein OCT59_012135 [Rhizophagus irregularis]|uniref:uncharacterized protein n=1 Tax=Rhizophagus irregularis TaxID=588596 RepID=UPI0033181A47|nr:hypothetical protein OCT59_012135 [Rhizophagus irregularis]